MEVDNEMFNDSDLSSEEETLLTDIKALKAFEIGPAPGPVKELQAISDPMDSIRLFASGIAEVAPTTSNLLDFNHLLIHNLKKMEKQVESKLKNNLDEQQRLESEIRSFRHYPKSEKFASFQKCGMPFFTTPCGWTQKKDEDTLYQESQGYSTPTQHFAPIFPWTHANNAEMTKLVVQFDKEAKLKKMEERIERIKKRGGRLKELSVLRDECNALKSNKNPQLDEKNIDWMRVSASLALDFGPTDCEYQWHSILSPSVNQKIWTRDETAQLHRIVKAHNYQSWDKIAAELGTNRSPLACCYQFQRTITRSTGPWTPGQTLKLKETMDRVGPSSRLPSHVAMICMDKSYNEITRKVKKLQKISFRQSRNEKIADLQGVFSSNALLEDAYFDKNLTRIRRKYLREIQLIGMQSKTDIALVKSVIKNGPNWEQVVEDVPATEDAERAKQRYQNLTCFLVEAVGLGKIPTNETHYHIASKLLPVLELIQETPVSRFGVNFKKNHAVQALVDVLTPVKPYMFGPRYSISLQNNNLRVLHSLSAFSSLLSVNFNSPEIKRRWESYSQITAAFSNDKFDITDVLDTLHGFTVPDYSQIRGRFIMPPNLATLLGIRTLLLSRSLLHQQSTLPLTQTNGTVINPDIAEEDRLHFSEAKNLLRERMRTLFFTSLVLSKVCVTNSLPAVAALPKKPRSRPMALCKKRKLMAQMSKSRWKRLKTEAVEEDDQC